MKIFRPRGVESDGLKYYQERNGDYVSIDPGTAEYYAQIGQPGMFEARCTAIKNQVSSVCTTGVSAEWLRKQCRRVSKASIPQEWLENL